MNLVLGLEAWGRYGRSAISADAASGWNNILAQHRHADRNGEPFEWSVKDVRYKNTDEEGLQINGAPDEPLGNGRSLARGELAH